jgi:hypothetical protein
MRIISSELDDEMQLSPSIGQRPAWRLGCFALTDVRYQLFFFPRGFISVIYCAMSICSTCSVQYDCQRSCRQSCMWL